MKITKTVDMYTQICSWDNLREAHRKAARGKRGKRAAAAFEYHLADHLLALEHELTAQTYQPGPYHCSVNKPYCSRRIARSAAGPLALRRTSVTIQRKHIFVSRSGGALAHGGLFRSCSAGFVRTPPGDADVPIRFEQE